jgi:urate oxidase
VGIMLGANRYGKAETRLVRVTRNGEVHTLKDLNVSIALAGDFADTHLYGDNTHVLPTDSQKNTVYAFAKEHGVGEIEDFALLLARHFVDSQPTVARARVAIDEFGWRRLGPHSFQRSGAETRSAIVTAEVDRAWVISGLSDLVLLNSTDSQFTGFVKDRYTTLTETTDRVLATAVSARWRHATTDGDWGASYAAVRDLLVQAFVDTPSLALQQTLYAMGRCVLEHRPDVVEVRLSLPNKHHFVVDLSPFGLDNPNEVFHADDRPYGLIQGVVERDDAPAVGPAWEALWSS